MRFLLFAAALWLTAPALADETSSARKTLDRGIAALGGAKRLADRALSGTSRGTAHVTGMKLTVSNEWTVQGFDQLKWASETTINDNTVNITLVMNGNKGWIKGNNAEASPIQKEQLIAFRQGVAGLRIAESLVPLTAREWKLTSLGEIKIDDQAAVGIKAVRKGLPELDLYFDKKTNLPVKAEMRIQEPGGMEISYTARFAEYKKVEGRMYFTRLTVYRDDKLALEMQRSDFKAKEKIDDETFSKP
jgi:hypothetical protein